MANVAHSTLTGSNLHEPKGVAAAAINKVYVSDGAGSGAWQKIGNSQTDGTVGALTFIKSQTLSGASTCDFVNGVSSVVFDGTYQRYFLDITNLTVSGSDVVIYWRVGTGGGPTYQSSTYSYLAFGAYGGGTQIGTGSTAQPQGSLTYPTTGSGFGLYSTAGFNYSGQFWINQPTLTTIYPKISGTAHYSVASGLLEVDVTSQYSTTGAITAFKLYPSSGTFSGTATLYGIRTS